MPLGDADAHDGPLWPGVVADLSATVQQALPATARELADALAQAARRLALDGATTDLVDEIATLCEQSRRVLVHNRHLADELGTLCRAMTDSLGELAEDESWARGQIDLMRERLAGGVTARGVRAAGDLLEATRKRQHELRREREQARDALKQLFQRMLGELGEIGTHTGRFNDQVQRHAETIARADSVQGLTDVVQELLGETRAVQQVVVSARERLQNEHARAALLEQRVRDLEGELRRLADEVSTDALTQVANRRGLMQAFDAERSRQVASDALLAVGLIDIDNFKKLNDSLGHAAGDIALKALAGRVKQWLSPADHVARFGGEEFVVLLPDTTVEAAQERLTKLQRQLSASLFMHDGREVFVTFSAGVTGCRADEALDDALERADQALYEAKRAGKNRTCIA
jgi:diguanylate cyclase